MNAKTWEAIEQIFNTLINENYRDEDESMDSWLIISSIEAETIPQLWEDAARQIGLPYRLQITIDNSELSYEKMKSLYVLLDGNTPFFAIPFQQVVYSDPGDYSGIKKEGLKKIVEAALSRYSSQQKASAVVEVFKNGETATECEGGISVVVVNHYQLGKELSNILADRFDHLRESDFFSLRDVIIKRIAEQMKRERVTELDVNAAFAVLDLSAVVQDACLDEKILNVWACPIGCDHNYVLICGGEGDEDGNDYFRAKLNGIYTDITANGSDGVPDDWFSHADGGCCNEPVCPECMNACVSGPVIDVSFASIWNGDGAVVKAKYLPATGKVYDVPLDVDKEGNALHEFIGLPDGTTYNLEIRDGHYFVVKA
ncbi:hypothetical protein [Paenibacillus sp. Y412MC10]|uniref:hypothetical protein n=1 Tax=Geobacillus sp. (strain Y412MC10) TaxID=481743 RepID=UPI0011AB585B|nr:hypothetical protein [Paenibacillus sp. Y412MC10]